MAGYIFVFNNIESLKKAIHDGVYSTIINLPTNRHWGTHHEGTFGDYITMNEGDNLYFFSNRKIYGIGRLVNIKGECKYLNFPGADLPYDYDFSTLKDNMILNDSPDNIKNRMLCTFRGAPYFFEQGIDIDDVLSSNPDSFKILRAFWKLSFIKVSDNENQALMDVILKSNEINLSLKSNIFLESSASHERIESLVNQDYHVSSTNLMSICSEKNGTIRHEMALESGILDYISNKVSGIFGHWDYLSHQVIASPFKPIDYMDKMDIFGYRFIPEFETISKYLVIEVKKGSADVEVVNQVMKYVDWVNQEYSYGDYNMIEAFIVANDFPEDVIKVKNDSGKRNYVKGRRPAVSLKWDSLRLIKYTFDINQKILLFTEI